MATNQQLHADIERALKTLPKLYETDDKDPSERRAVKIFNPYGIGTWFLVEYDPEQEIAFGLCDLGSPELGYVSLSDLKTLVHPFGGKLGFAFERDRHFEGTLADGWVYVAGGL